MLEWWLKVIAAIEELDEVPQSGGLKNTSVNAIYSRNISNDAHIVLAIFLGHIRIVLAQLRQFLATEQQFLCATNETLVHPQICGDIVCGQANTGFRLL